MHASGSYFTHLQRSCNYSPEPPSVGLGKAHFTSHPFPSVKSWVWWGSGLQRNHWTLVVLLELLFPFAGVGSGVKRWERLPPVLCSLLFVHGRDQSSVAPPVQTQSWALVAGGTCPWPLQFTLHPASRLPFLTPISDYAFHLKSIRCPCHCLKNTVPAWFSLWPSGGLC